MNASLKITSFDVKGESKQDAYKKVCKIMAHYVGQNYITFSVHVDKEDETIFNVTLFTNMDMNAMQRDYCKICKEMHCQFYINEEYNCNRCKLKAFLTRVKRAANISKGFYKDNMK